MKESEKEQVINMHYHCEVHLKDGESEKTVDQIMEPYYEDNEEGFYDWYQIGGRWTGVHDGYDPTKDERNYKVCYLCHGTGDRDYPAGNESEITGFRWVWYDIDNVRHFRDEWAEKCNGCNGCEGTGMELKHPTEFVWHEGDIMEVSKIKDDLTCYTLIVEGDVYHEFEGSVKEFLNKLGIHDGWLVTVDYHC